MIPVIYVGSRHRPASAIEVISPEFLPIGSGTITNPTTAVETVVFSLPVAANQLRVGAAITLLMHLRVAAVSNFIYMVRFGTTATVADTLLYTSTTTANQAANSYTTATLNAIVTAIGTNGQIVVSGSVQASTAVVGRITGVFTIPTVNTTVANFLSITVRPSGAAAHTVLGATAIL